MKQLTNRPAVVPDVNDPTALAAEPAAFTTYVKSVKAVAPAALPIIDWETGASTFNMSEAQQAEWARLMIDTVRAEGLAGFNWWQFIDWSPIPSEPCTKPNCNLQLHFGAHYTNGSAKAVWEVLTAPSPT